MTIFRPNSSFQHTRNVGLQRVSLKAMKIPVCICLLRNLRALKTFKHSIHYTIFLRFRYTVIQQQMQYYVNQLKLPAYSVLEQQQPS